MVLLDSFGSIVVALEYGKQEADLQRKRPLIYYLQRSTCLRQSEEDLHVSSPSWEVRLLIIVDPSHIHFCHSFSELMPVIFSLVFGLPQVCACLLHEYLMLIDTSRC